MRAGNANKSGRYGLVMRKRGFEPLRYCYRQPLKLVRLPVPPLPRGERSTIVSANEAGGGHADRGVRLSLPCSHDEQPENRAQLTDEPGDAADDANRAAEHGAFIARIEHRPHKAGYVKETSEYKEDAEN